MSLGDTLRLLRAQRGGITPLEIETALPDLPRGIYRQMEQRYRLIGDDDSIRLLAGFFGVPYVELRAQLEWPRKALSRAFVYAQTRDILMSLHLSTGEHITGKVAWWDLGAVGLVTTGGEWVVQRHAVRQWEPRAPEETLDGDTGDE